jgi:hypothetical protein
VLTDSAVERARNTLNEYKKEIILEEGRLLRCGAMSVCYKSMFQIHLQDRRNNASEEKC